MYAKCDATWLPVFSRSVMKGPIGTQVVRLSQP